MIKSPTDTDFLPPEPYNLLPCNPPPRSLLALEPPPASPPLPSLPTAPRTAGGSLLEPWFTLSTHLVPAAYPRTTPFVPLSSLSDVSKLETKKASARLAKELISSREQYWRGELDRLPRNRKPLWVCVNRYIRRGTSREGRGITLFLTHAVGFHKEIWEPFLRTLVSEHAAVAEYDIDEIWAFEAANHGDAGLVNKDHLGILYDWKDNARDMLHFLLHYLPDRASDAALPIHLPRLPDRVAEERKASGFLWRDVVPMGMSFGACSLIRAAIHHPVLFRSLTVLDPVLFPSAGKIDFSFMPQYVLGALLRQDGWPSREAAHKAFASSPFFRAWDPAALAVYVECGLYETPSGTVRLKTRPVQEAVTFADHQVPPETFELLAHLDERVELRWVVPGKNDDGWGPLRRKQVWRRPVNSSSVVIAEAGHLLAMEAPGQVARYVHESLCKRYGSSQARL